MFVIYTDVALIRPILLPYDEVDRLEKIIVSPKELNSFITTGSLNSNLGDEK